MLGDYTGHVCSSGHVILFTVSQAEEVSTGGCSWWRDRQRSQQQLTSGGARPDRKPLAGFGTEVVVSRAEAPSLQAAHLVVSSSGADLESKFFKTGFLCVALDVLELAL